LSRSTRGELRAPDTGTRAQTGFLGDTDDTKWLRRDIARKHNTAHVIPRVNDVPTLSIERY